MQGLKIFIVLSEKVPNFCGDMLRCLRSSEVWEGVEDVLLTAEGDGLDVRFRI